MRRDEIDLETAALRHDPFALERRKFVIRRPGDIRIKKIIKSDVIYALPRTQPVADARGARRVHAKKLVGLFKRRIFGECRLQPGDPVGPLPCFTVGNALETRAEHAAYCCEDLARVAKRHAANEVNVTHEGSVEMKLIELAVFGQDTPYSARHRTHHDGLGFDHILAKF